MDQEYNTSYGMSFFKLWHASNGELVCDGQVTRRSRRRKQPRWNEHHDFSSFW